MKSIIYFVSEDWYFCSHRLPIARKALTDGFKVVVITRINKHRDIIKSEGFELAPIEIKRGGINLFSEVRTISTLYSYYKQYNPDIVHHVAIKPVIYGTLIARLIGSIKIVNAMAGLGFVFISNKKRIKLLRFFVHQLFRFLFNNKNSQLILQNKDDLGYFLKNKLVKKEQVSIVRGSGVNINKFVPVEEPAGIAIIMLASRMLWDKGVGEFVEAVKILKQEGVEARFVLVGVNDYENPASISNRQLEEWGESASDTTCSSFPSSGLTGLNPFKQPLVFASTTCNQLLLSSSTSANTKSARPSKIVSIASTVALSRTPFGLHVLREMGSELI
jgi:glycosyltransferase involved in cell wall biosynthesis